jgi:hypothetical protein
MEAAEMFRELLDRYEDLHARYLGLQQTNTTLENAVALLTTENQRLRAIVGRGAE